MSRVIILGQAPSRVGDGRPFSGPSGARLCGLTGLSTYDALAEAFELRNLIKKPVPKTAGKGDDFDLDSAREGWAIIRRQLPGDFRLLCAGRQVAKAIGLSSRARLLSWSSLRTGYSVYGKVAVIPHPSGISHYWNDPEKVRAAAAFLAPLAHRA